MKRWLRLRQLARRVQIRRTLKKLQQELDRAVLTNHAYRSRIDLLQEDLQSQLQQIGRLDERLHDYAEQIKHYERENDGLRAELSVMKQSVIPAMAAAHKLQVETVNTAIAHQVRHGLVRQPPQEED